MVVEVCVREEGGENLSLKGITNDVSRVVNQG